MRLLAGHLSVHTQNLEAGTWLTLCSLVMAARRVYSVEPIVRSLRALSFADNGPWSLQWSINGPGKYPLTLGPTLCEAPPHRTNPSGYRVLRLLDMVPADVQEKNGLDKAIKLSSWSRSSRAGRKKLAMRWESDWSERGNIEPSGAGHSLVDLDGCHSAEPTHGSGGPSHCAVSSLSGLVFLWQRHQTNSCQSFAVGFWFLLGGPRAEHYYQGQGPPRSSTPTQTTAQRLIDGCDPCLHLYALEQRVPTAQYRVQASSQDIHHPPL